MTNKYEDIEGLNRLLIRAYTQNPTDDWVKISHKLFGYMDDPFLAGQIQNLGRLDSFIRLYEPLPNDLDEITNNFFFLSFIRTLSDLWIIGVYEILRTSKINDVALKSIQAEFAMLRNELAKHQISGKNKFRFPDLGAQHQGNNFQLIYKYLKPDESGGTEKVISRIELSNQLIEGCLKIMGSTE